MSAKKRLAYEMSIAAERDLSACMEASYEEGVEKGIDITSINSSTLKRIELLFGCGYPDSEYIILIFKQTVIPSPGGYSMLYINSLTG